MKKTLIAAALLLSVNIFAGTITKTNGVYSDKDLEAEVNKQLGQIETDLNADPMVKLTGNQTEFATGNANANAASIINGSLYSGLDAGIAAASFSFGGATENPGKAFTLADDIQDGTDSYTGAAVSGFATNVLINANTLPFIPIDGLLLETKFAYFSGDDIIAGLGYESLLIGAGARYKIAALPVQAPMFKLRALTVGAGIYYASSTMTFESDPIEKNQTSNVNIAGKLSDVETRTETVLDFELKNQSVIIPVEVVTSAKAIYFLNIIAGTGFDLVMGQTTVKVDSDSTINVYKDGALQKASTNPDLALSDSETKESPSIARFKIIYGVGLNLGPARVEVPVAYYPASGFAISAVAGAAF